MTTKKHYILCFIYNYYLYFCLGIDKYRINSYYTATKFKYNKTFYYLIYDIGQH